MKVVRVIKIIFLIAAIICLAVTAAGNAFIMKDACDNDMTVQEVHEVLDNYEFKIGSIFKGAYAEGEDSTEDATDDTTTTTEPEVIVEPTAAPTVVTEPDTNPEVTEPEGYTVDSHIGIVRAVMKAGNARIKLGFLKNLSFDLCDFGTVGMRSDSSENGEPVFEVNLWLLISFLAFTVAFILHLFSKKVKKTVWGIILHIFGYLLICAFFACGQVLANIDINLLSKTAVTDFAAYRIYVVAGACALGFLMGLGYIRCGSRAMKRRKRKSSSGRR